MVFIKLQYKDNIKKILLAKEEISWQKICEILNQIFNLGDSANIRLLYKDEEDQTEEVFIKSNEDLLEILNKKLMKKFVKFFVFYSGIVENDTDILFTSLSMPKKQSQLQLGKPEKRLIDKIPLEKSQHSEQCNRNEVIGQQQQQQQQRAPKKGAEPKIDHQNGLLEVESQDQLKTILSRAITKSNVFEKIKDQIRLFINEQNSSNTSPIFQEEDQASKIIEYSVQTNLQQLSDLFVNNIRDVIEEESSLVTATAHATATTEQSMPPIEQIAFPSRKLSENLSDKPKNRISKLKRKPIEPKESKPLINESDINQESVYISEARNRIRRSSTTGFGSLHEIVSSQEKDLLRFENALEKSQRVTEQLINDQFDKSFNSIHHLFQSISSKGATPTGDSAIRRQQNLKRTISAHELSQLLDKQVEQYASLNDSDDFSSDKDFESPSMFDSIISEQITLKNQKVSFSYKPNLSRYTQQFTQNQQFEDPNPKLKLLSKISEVDGFEHLDRSHDEQEKETDDQIEDTIVQFSSPLKDMIHDEDENKHTSNEKAGVTKHIKENHFYITEEKKAICQIDSSQKPRIIKPESARDAPVNNHSTLDNNNDDDEIDSHPQLILTKKISHKYSNNPTNQKPSAHQL